MLGGEEAWANAPKDKGAYLIFFFFFLLSPSNLFSRKDDLFVINLFMVRHIASFHRIIYLSNNYTLLCPINFLPC